MALIRGAASYIRLEFRRILKFLMVGGISAVVNLAAMVFLVEFLDFGGFYSKNVANLISIEISIIFAFVLNKQWTWKSVSNNGKKRFVWQFVLFHLAGLGAISIRAVLFLLLEIAGVHYVVNVIFGIGLTSIINYIVYDKYVFRGTKGARCLDVCGPNGQCEVKSLDLFATTICKP